MPREGKAVESGGLMRTTNLNNHKCMQADLQEGRTVMEEGCNFTIQGLEHKVLTHTC